VSFNFRIIIFVDTLCTPLVLILEVNFNFQLVSELGTLWLDLFLECYLFFTSFLKLIIMFLPLMVRTTAIGRHVCVSFLKSIDCWSIVEIG
jgi:hypothetical protein